VKDALKEVVGERGTRAAQRLGRFRFLLKARRVREEGARMREHPVAITKFVLLDPETHSYSYELGNRGELVEFCASLLGIQRSEAAAYLAETDSDPELGTRLRRRTVVRIDAKWRLPLGNRLLWYVVARAVKPRLTVETGIFDGLGSLMLLRALERNAAEGVDGRLLSIDLDPASGWIVPDRLRGRWEPVFGDIFTDLEPALADRDVDLLIHDSVHDERFQRFEFGLALAHGDGTLHVVDCSGLTLPVLRELCAERDGRHAYFLERPARHFYKPEGTAVAVFERGG
jgi:Methyltransferase domain